MANLLNVDINLIVNRINDIINSSNNVENCLQSVCNFLHDNIPYYDWVGYYFANPTQKTLHLGPYKGAPTEHTVIPFGKGICGQVALSNQTFIVEDVSTQQNYISCSVDVKSEIVVPLFLNSINIGQIDIDSNSLQVFTSKDEKLLKRVNGIVSNYLEKNKYDSKTVILEFIA